MTRPSSGETVPGSHYGTSNLSSVSLRNLLLPHILAHPLQPSETDPEKKYQGSPPHELESAWFTNFGDRSSDLRHVNTRGHKACAELLEVFTRRTMCSVLREDKMEELGLSSGG